MVDTLQEAAGPAGAAAGFAGELVERSAGSAGFEAVG